MSQKVVVITGSASGIGLGLAKSFLQRGHLVVISDLTEASLLDAENNLLEFQSRFASFTCDVTDYSQLQGLWDFAIEKFSKIDIWYNNAGSSSDNKMIRDTENSTLLRVIDVNIRGVVFGSKVAVNGMTEQGFGQLYNASGFGGEGTIRAGMTIYGCSKRAVAYFSKSLAREQKGTAVQVGWVNPGMVITPMVINEAKAMDVQRWKEGRKVFNWFGETVETTTNILAERMLANTKNGTQIHLLPLSKMLRRIAMSYFRKRDLFVEYGV